MTIRANPAQEALVAFKRTVVETWSAGDYDAVSRTIWPVGEEVVRRASVAAGEDVLDVACGTGNVAIRAAEAGARATGLDITPSLLEVGRRRADEAGVGIEWVEGDAEALPFDDASFDVVLSTFGVMFAPRHEVSAREIARVLRPGGRIGICSWTATGTVGQMFKAVAGHLPPPPAFAASPLSWGSEEHVREIFKGTGVELGFARAFVPLDPDVDPEEAVSFYLTTFGPLIKAREALEPSGGWAKLEQEVTVAITAMLTIPPEYLVVTGAKR